MLLGVVGATSVASPAISSSTGVTPSASPTDRPVREGGSHTRIDYGICATCKGFVPLKNGCCVDHHLDDNNRNCRGSRQPPRAVHGHWETLAISWFNETQNGQNTSTTISVMGVSVRQHTPHTIPGAKTGDYPTTHF